MNEEKLLTLPELEVFLVYGSHPKLKAFSTMVDPMLAEVMVIDYWAS